MIVLHTTLPLVENLTWNANSCNVEKQILRLIRTLVKVFELQFVRVPGK